jgi:hypothetical protein
MRVLVVFFFCLCAGCALAQVDTLEDGLDTSQVSQPAVPGEQSPKLDENAGVYNEASIRIQREEVPLFLQKILQDDKYRGWESGGVYRNESNTMYKVQVMDAMHNGTYYFDKDGKLLRAE